MDTVDANICLGQTLPAESASFGNYRKIKAEELGQYAVPRLVHAFIEKYVDSK